MAYRFKLNESASAAVSRIGLEQIDSVEACLTSREDGAAAIHNARRCLKRLRALLRLVRPSLPETVYRREATRLANVGRLLADARDQHVMRETLTKLEKRFGQLPNGVAAKLLKLMANGSGAAHGAAQERRRVLDGIEQARAFFTGLARRPITFEHVAAGAERSYRRARRAFREAYENPASEAFHDWRKAVQQHWRHMQLLSRAWPDVLGGRATEAKELSRLLGDDHDVHVLLAFVQDRGRAVLPDVDVGAIAGMCQTVEDELRRQAKPRGARLFSEPASSMRKCIEHYWSAARELSEVMPAAEKDDIRRPRRDIKKTRSLVGKPSAASQRRAQAASRGTAVGPVRRSGR